MRLRKIGFALHYSRFSPPRLLRWLASASTERLQFVGQGLLVSLLGSAAGLGLALVFTRVLARMLFGVSPSDQPTLSGVIAIMLAVAACASLVPAVRASRVEPMQVLRDQ
jgi:ABC-type antimicrobial peptide transport system permease subunit